MSDIEFEQVAELAQRLSRDERFRLIENILATNAETGECGLAPGC
jgi:hypothetical protein